MTALPTTNLTANWDASVSSGHLYASVVGDVPTGSVASGGAVGAWKSTVNAAHLWIPNSSVTVFQPPDITWENDAVLYLPSLRLKDGSMRAALATAGGVAGSLPTSTFMTNAAKTAAVAFRVDSTASLANHATGYFNSFLVGNAKNEYFGFYLRNNAGTLTLYAYNWDGSADLLSTTLSFNTRYVAIARHFGGTFFLTVLTEGGSVVVDTSIASGNTTNVGSAWRLAESNAAGTEQYEGRLGQISTYNAGLTGDDFDDLKAHYTEKWLTAGLPTVDAGPDQTTPFTGSGTLAGSVSGGGSPTIGWTVLFGTGTLTVTDPTNPTSGFTVSIPGTYLLQLSADSVTDTVTLVFTEPEVSDDSCPGASPGPAICGRENVLAWIEQTQRKTDASTETRVVTDVPGLNDEADFYFGRKEPRVLEYGPITRQVSGVLGQWQGSTMRWREAETDGAVRSRFGSALTYPVSNTTDVCRMIRESDYVARNDARLMFIGHRLRSTPLEDMSVEHESGDQLARDLEASRGEETQCPRRLFSQSFTPGIPQSLVDVAEAIIYGKETDELSEATPPDFTASAEYGGYLDGVNHNFGWGELPSPPEPPSGVALTELTGGEIDLGDFPGNRIGVMVTHVDGANQSDPDTFDQNAVVEITLGADDARIQVDWTEEGTPTATRVYFGYFFSGTFRPAQVIQVNAGTTQVIFDNTPSFDEIGLNDFSQLATGAEQPGYSNFGYYYVAAKMPDGRWTGLNPTFGFGIARGYRRPTRIEVDTATIPATATHVGIWKYGPGASPITDPDLVPIGMWEVPVSQVLGNGNVYQDDDLLGTGMITGVSAPIERGKVDLADYYGGVELVTVDGGYRPRWFVASHACARVRVIVDGVKQATPGAWIWPGTAEHTARFGNSHYRDFNGRRYSVVYGPVVAEGVEPTLPELIRANVWGVEDIGDGTGTVLTDVHDQFLHWMKNFGPLGDYQSGAYLAAPTWSPIASHCKINAESFRTVRDAAAAALAGGIVGSGVIRELASQRDWMAKWLVSLGARIGQNAAGQWTLVRQDPTATPSATYTEIRHVQVGSVRFTPLHEEHWTVLPYRFGFDPIAGVWREGVETATQEETDYSERRPGPTFELFFIQSPTIAQWIMGRTKDLHKVLPWRVEFETIDLCGTNSDNGDVIALTGSWGLGTDGWQAFPIFVEWHTTLPTEQRARLTGRTNVAPQEAP